MSASVRMTLWPFPELDMSGFTTQGMPTAATPASNSARDVAYR